MTYANGLLARRPSPSPSPSLSSGPDPSRRDWRGPMHLFAAAPRRARRPSRPDKTSFASAHLSLACRLIKRNRRRQTKAAASPFRGKFAPPLSQPEPAACSHRFAPCQLWLDKAALFPEPNDMQSDGQHLADRADLCRRGCCLFCRRRQTLAIIAGRSVGLVKQPVGRSANWRVSPSSASRVMVRHLASGAIGRLVCRPAVRRPWQAELRNPQPPNEVRRLRARTQRPSCATGRSGGLRCGRKDPKQDRPKRD